MESLWLSPPPRSLQMGGAGPGWASGIPQSLALSQSHCRRSCVGGRGESSALCRRKEPDPALALICRVTFSKSISFSGPPVGKRGLRFFRPCSPPKATSFIQPVPSVAACEPTGPACRRGRCWLGWAGLGWSEPGTELSSALLPAHRCCPLPSLSLSVLCRRRDSIGPSVQGSTSNRASV